MKRRGGERQQEGTVVLEPEVGTGEDTAGTRRAPYAEPMNAQAGQEQEFELRKWVTVGHSEGTRGSVILLAVESEDKRGGDGKRSPLFGRSERGDLRTSEFVTGGFPLEALEGMKSFIVLPRIR